MLPGIGTLPIPGTAGDWLSPLQTGRCAVHVSDPAAEGTGMEWKYRMELEYYGSMVFGTTNSYLY